MSTPVELERKTVLAWRNFLQTNEAQAGLDYLRRVRRPSIDRSTQAAMMESTIGQGFYLCALEDIEDVLTAIPKVEKPLDEPPMEAPGSDVRDED